MFFRKKIKNVRDLQRIVAEAAVSSSAKVDVWRDKKIKKFKVKLAEREKFEDQAKVDQKKDSTEKTNQEYEIDQVGLRLKDLTDFLRDQYNIDESVSGSVITGVKNNSPSSKAGLSVGNVISQVSQKKITSEKQAKQIFDDAVKRNMDSVLVQIYQNGFPRFIPLKLK